MATDIELPETMRALVLKSPSSEPTVEIVPTPKPAVGSAVVRVLSASVLYYLRDMYLGKRPNSLPKPSIIGTSAIARLVAPGPDATKLTPGDLVFVDIILRSRDDATDVFLAGIHDGFSAGSRKLMTDGYRDWTYAEYCLTPLENLSLLDERRLLGDPGQGGLGYKLEDLNFLTTLLVPYGGLKDIQLQTGQTVIVAPATGSFGGAAVLVALAMGARVIAMGRNTTLLANLKKKVPMPDRLETVQVTGDIAADCEELKKFGEIDAYFDIGPPQGYASTHIKSCILALRHGARISLMGGYREDIALPHVRIMQREMKFYGKWMYERSDIPDLIKLVEHGMLKLGEQGGSQIMGRFPLEQWREAWTWRSKRPGLVRRLSFSPRVSSRAISALGNVLLELQLSQ